MKNKPLCHNRLDLDYTIKDALTDLNNAIERGNRPIDPRNLEPRAIRHLPRW